MALLGVVGKRHLMDVTVFITNGNWYDDPSRNIGHLNA